MSHPTAEYSGSSHGSVASYLTGFILSVILTAIPFVMVMNGHYSYGATMTTVLICAVVQLLVHVVCFLHLNTASENRWNLTAFIFTLIIIAIVVGGSVWIMWNLNLNMMPG